LKISALTAGALFMAGSSSAPEFFTAFSGVVFYKIFEIGILTIVWSALFNLCIIIGLCSQIQHPLVIEKQILKRDLPVYGLAIILLAALGIDGNYTGYDFFLLICFYVAYTISLCFDKANPYRIENADSWKNIILKILIGLGLVSFLSHMLVTFGLQIISQAELLFNLVIPVSVVSILVLVPATSLPDLFVSVSAVKKGKTSVAVGNGIGSNTFDLTICLGIPGLIYTLMTGKQVSVYFNQIYPSLMMLFGGYLLLFGIAIYRKEISKRAGLGLSSYFFSAVLVQLMTLAE
jgi:cation:H+ antiporter